MIMSLLMGKNMNIHSAEQEGFQTPLQPANLFFSKLVLIETDGIRR